MGTATATPRRRAPRAAPAVPQLVTVAPQPATPPDPGLFTAPVLANGLVVLDHDRSTYMALNRDGSRWHTIKPAIEGEWVVREGHRRPGQLTCDCESGRVRGSCYRVTQAEAYEAEQADERAWPAMWSDEAVAP